MYIGVWYLVSSQPIPLLVMRVNLAMVNLNAADRQ